MLTVDQRHRHSWMSGDWQKIRFDDLEWVPTFGGKYATGFVSYNSLWTKTVSWIGFTPKFIKINANVSGSPSGFSDGVWSSGFWPYCRYCYSTGWAVATGNVWYSAYCQKSGNASIATTITPTSDGFTINVTTVLAWDLNIIYECFG